MLTASSGPSPGACSVRTSWEERRRRDRNPPLRLPRCVLGDKRGGMEKIESGVLWRGDGQGQEVRKAQGKGTRPRRGEDEGWMQGKLV
jgi:hypothetical protein